MISRGWNTISLTDAEYNRLERWYNRNFKNQNFGAIGGGMSFRITPTSLGDVIKAECGNKEFIIRNDLNPVEEEIIKVLFGFDAQFVGSFEKELELPSDTTDEQLIQIFETLMELKFDENCYIKINGEILELIE